MSWEARSVKRSMSRGVTSIFGISTSTSTFVRFRIIVCISTTVGTPTAITGTPRKSFESSFLEFETPLPGDMPLSQICIVVPRRLTSEQASASAAMTADGLISLHIARISSAVSMPVWPMTPPATELTRRRSERKLVSLSVISSSKIHPKTSKGSGIQNL